MKVYIYLLTKTFVYQSWICNENLDWCLEFENWRFWEEKRKNKRDEAKGEEDDEEDKEEEVFLANINFDSYNIPYCSIDPPKLISIAI